jgi:hypothetical protein
MIAFRMKKGAPDNAHLFSHCNRRLYGGGRTWRLLLASPASGCHATTEISERVISPFRSSQPRAVPRPGLFLSGRCGPSGSRNLNPRVSDRLMEVRHKRFLEGRHQRSCDCIGNIIVSARERGRCCLFLRVMFAVLVTRAVRPSGHAQSARQLYC